MTLPPKNQALRKHREAVLKCVQEGAHELYQITNRTGLDDRTVDRALQFWRKEGKLVYRTVKQSKRDKPAGWHVT